MLRWVVVWLLLCFGFSVTRAQNVNISASPASCNEGWAQGITCVDPAHNSAEHISITPDFSQRNSTMSSGYVFISAPVRMRDPNTFEGASFSCRFTFKITPTNTDSYNNLSGDGIAFVMFANESFRGNSGGTLGVYKWQDPNKYGSVPGHQGTKTFAVEYDTYNNTEVDPSDNHVGVDVENAKSRVTAEAGSVGINLKGGYKIETWIDYSFPRLQLEVRIANATQAKPANALITYNVNLSTIVADFMSVGIAASTGGSTEYHELYDLYFTTYGLPPLSPIPSPQPPEAARGNDDSKVVKNVIVGVSTGAASLLALLCLGCFICFMKARRAERTLGDESFHDYELAALDMPHRFTYKQLSVATNGFSEDSKLGEGGTSTVYRGTLPSSGTEVAVKKVANKSKQGENEFLAEIRVVSRLRHRNLVKLLGWCSDRMNFLLVYELMPNGSLDKPLFQERGSEVRILTWTRRLAILRGVAAALAYLHEGYAEQVIHRDIKSSNVMLDQEFNARLGDFGLARLIEHNSKNSAATQLAGTPGYIAPEVFEGWRCTDKTDVYAFGALSLELVCGRRPIDRSCPKEEEILVNWVWRCHSLGRILSVVDTRLAADRPHNDSEIMDILLIGLLCSHPDPNSRPSMREVELYLERHLSLPSVPLRKPVPIYSTSSQHHLREVRAIALAEARSPPHFSSCSNMTVSGSVSGPFSGSIHSTSESTNRVHSAAISA